MTTPERKVVEKAQEDTEAERAGREQAADDPVTAEDERGDRRPPEPFSGPTR